MDKVDIVIPVLNEEEMLRERSAYFGRLKSYAKVIFVDGGSSDGTVEAASGLGRVFISERGRAWQMNRGAKEAKGDVLLFLHADSFVGGDAIADVRACIYDGAIGGCLTQRLDNDRTAYRFIEDIGNKRARQKKIFYGDQGIFVRKDVFFSLGGFPDVQVMEDMLFSEVLSRSGRTEVLDAPVVVSTRRWEKKGFFKTNLLYITMTVLFYLHVPPAVIKKLYRDVR